MNFLKILFHSICAAKFYLPYVTFAAALPDSIMVVQKILALLVWVRILIGQQHLPVLAAGSFYL